MFAGLQMSQSVFLCAGAQAGKMSFSFNQLAMSSSLREQLESHQSVKMTSKAVDLVNTACKRWGSQSQSLSCFIFSTSKKERGLICS